MTALNVTEWLHPRLVPFFTLSYPTARPEHPDSFPNAQYYGTGPQDVFIIVTFIAVMAILRDFFRLFVFEPFVRWRLYRDARLRSNSNAKKLNGNGVSNGNGAVHSNGNSQDLHLTKKERKQIQHSILRFAEQGWPMVYYPGVMAFGLYVNRELPTNIFNPVELWINYPHIPLAGPVKLYYLIETAFYTHQILILNAEAHRSDHWQMMTHHIITVFLMGASYFCNFTRVGCIIMALMDWCDIFLPLAKMLRYLQMSRVLVDGCFAFFLVSWFVTRHILLNIVIYSTIFDSSKLINWVYDPARSIYAGGGAYYIFVSCLLALEGLALYWFCMMMRIAARLVITGEEVTDDRSEDEADDTNDEKEE